MLHAPKTRMQTYFCIRHTDTALDLNAKAPASTILSARCTVHKVHNSSGMRAPKQITAKPYWSLL